MKEVSALSDKELVAVFETLVRKEHAAMIEVLIHLAEIDTRRLYLGLGYNSLFAYCVEKFRYSEGAAMRRIKAARCLRKYPLVLEYLQEKKLSLCALAVISDVIGGENIAQILDRCSGKSKREVESIICEFKPEEKRQIREEIKAIPFRAAANSSNAVSGKNESAMLPMFEKADADKCESILGIADSINSLAVAAQSAQVLQGLYNADLEVRAPIFQPEVEQRYKITFSADRAFSGKLTRVKELLSGKFPKGGSLEEVFGALLDFYIEQKSPEARIKRRDKRLARIAEAKNKQFVQESKKESENKRNIAQRHIPQAVKDEVAARDNYCCSFVGQDGKRCSSRIDLEFDHVQPFSLSGESTAENLRLLCRSHNIHAAENVYGKRFIKRRIEAAQLASLPFLDG